MFVNYTPNNIPITIYSRIKAISVYGDKIPVQDLPAITNNSPIYLMGQNVLGGNEVIRLRGWNSWRLGDSLIHGTIEPRFGNKQFVLSCFVDFGNAWYKGKFMSDMLYTAGYEVKVNIGLIILAYGTAQDFNRWKGNKSPSNYLQMSLVNPF